MRVLETGGSRSRGWDAGCMANVTRAATGWPISRWPGPRRGPDRSRQAPRSPRGSAAP